MKNLILGLLIVVPIFLSAQVKFSKDFDITTGNPYRVIDAPVKLYFSVDGKSAISVKVRGEYVTLQLFDAEKMQEVTRHEYKDFPKYTKIQDVITIGEKMYYIFEAFNKKADNFSVYYREINRIDATFGKINKLFTTKGVVVNSKVDPLEKTTPFSGLGFNSGPKFTVYQSFDQSKIMIAYRNKPKERNDDKNKDVIGVYVFDSAFNPIWHGEKRMLHTEADMNNLAYGISNKGTAYMLTFLNNSKSYALLAFTESGELKENKLDIDGKKIVQKFNIKEDEEGNLVFAGFYANGIDIMVNWTGNPSWSFNTNGLFYFEMNANGRVTDIRDFPFSIDFIKQYQTKHQKKKSNKREAGDKAGIADLKLIEFNMMNDGSFIFVGEQRYVRNEMYGTSTKTVFHYAHMVMIKMNKNGELAWMVKLPKNQAGMRGRGSMGAKYMQGNGRHYLLYLDNEENANISINQAPKAYKDGAEGFLSAYVIDDESGKVNKHLILSTKNIKGIRAYQFKTSRIFYLQENTSMFEIYIKGKKDTMVKLELVN